jgi:HEAT repeat protein
MRRALLIQKTGQSSTEFLIFTRQRPPMTPAIARVAHAKLDSLTAGSKSLRMSIHLPARWLYLALISVVAFAAPAFAQPPEIAKAVRGLHSDDPDVFSESIETLVSSYSQNKRAILALLDRDDEETTNGVRIVVGRIGNSAVVDLAAVLKDAGNDKTERILSIFDSMFDLAAPALPAIHQIIPKAKSERQIRMIETIGRIHDKSSVAVLARLLKAKDENVRLAAVGELATFGPDAQSALSELFSTLKTDDSSLVIIEANTAIPLLGALIIPTIKKELESGQGSAAYRHSLVCMLGRITCWHAEQKEEIVGSLSILLPLAKDRDKDMRRCALESIRQIASRYGDDPKIERQVRVLWKDKLESVSIYEKQDIAAIAAQYRANRQTAEALFKELVRNPVPEIRQSALDREITLHLSWRILPYIWSRMFDCDYRVRDAASRAFFDTPYRVLAVPVLIHMAAYDPSNECREFARWQFKYMLNSLLESLRDLRQTKPLAPPDKFNSRVAVGTPVARRPYRNR